MAVNNVWMLLIQRPGIQVWFAMKLAICIGRDGCFPCTNRNSPLALILKSKCLAVALAYRKLFTTTVEILFLWAISQFFITVVGYRLSRKLYLGALLRYVTWRSLRILYDGVISKLSRTGENPYLRL